MKLEDQVCSLEIAKKLKELGIKQDSFYAWCAIKSKLKHNESRLTCAQAITHTLYRNDIGEHYSAFTVSELTEILPDFIGSKSLTMFCCLRRGWWCEYADEVGEAVHAYWDKTLSNVLAKMLICLIEKGIITISDINKEK